MFYRFLLVILVLLIFISCEDKIAVSDLCDNKECQENSYCDVLSGICVCNAGFHLENDLCLSDNPDNLCEGIDCGAGVCVEEDAGQDGQDGGQDGQDGQDGGQVNALSVRCECDAGAHIEDGICVIDVVDACGGCSGHGECFIKEDNDPVCACEIGYNPSDRVGLDCVLTSTVCKTGAIDFDVDGDGINETSFTPTDLECSMFELVNFVRAVHDKEGSPESHKPLLYNVLFSAYARYHSLKMAESGGLYHEDFPPGWRGQNCAYNYTGTALSHMNQYMGGVATEPICESDSEPHCGPNVLSHHCNIMKPTNIHIGVGLYLDGGRSYSTQNF